MSDFFAELLGTAGAIAILAWLWSKVAVSDEPYHHRDGRDQVDASVNANLEFEFEAENEEEAAKIAAMITKRLQGLVDDGTAESVKVNKLRRKPDDDDDLSDACEMQSLL